MLHDPRVRKLSFTGSTEVGRDAAQGGRRPGGQLLHGARRQRPLRGLRRCRPRAAIDGAMIAKMRNGGEACTAANRFYRAGRASSKPSPRASPSDGGADRRPRLRPGDARCGPMINADAVATHLRPRRRRRRAAARAWSPAASRSSATASTTRRPSSTGVPAGAEISREEIFGPVAAIRSFADRG